MTAFIDCLRGRVGKQLIASLEARRDALMQREGVDAATADAMLEAQVRADAGDAVKAKLRQIMVDTDIIRGKIPEELARQQAYYDSLTAWSGAKALYRKFSRYGEPSEASAFRAVVQQADDFAKAQALMHLGVLEQTVAHVSPAALFRLKADPKIMQDVFRVIGGEADAVSDATAKAIGKEFAKAFKGVAGYWRASGGILGDIEHYYPIQHDANKMLAMGKDAWMKAWRDMNDLSQIKDFSTGQTMTEQRFAELAEQTWDDITTDGATARERNAARRAAGEGITKRKLGGDLFASRAQSRFSRPKDVDAFLDYNRIFGVGDEGLYNMATNAIAKMAHDAALMERLGPKPVSLFNNVQSRVHGIPNFPPTEIIKMRAEMATLLGDWEGSSDMLLAKATRAGQNIVSAGLLGGAAVSALGDIPFAALRARARGMSAFRSMGNWLGSVTQTAGRNADTRAYRVAEAIQMGSISRFTDESALKAEGIAYGLNSKVHKLSGLNYITNMTADAGVLTFTAELARVLEKAGVDLAAIGAENANFAKLLTRHDVTDADLALIARYAIDPDTQMVSRNYGLASAAGSDEFDAVAKALRKVGGLEFELRRAFTSMPDLQVRSWGSGRRFGNTVEGSGAHLIMSSVMQFKSFPFTVFVNDFVPSMAQALSGRGGDFAALLLASTFMGTMVVQLKQRIKGETFYEWENPILYKRALYQAGFMGLMGDAMFGDYTDIKRNYVEALAGPLPATVADMVFPIVNATVDHVFSLDSDPDNFRDMTYDLASAGSRLIPTQSMWYWRSWFDQNVRGGTLESIDPARYHRAQREKWRRKAVEERVYRME